MPHLSNCLRLIHLLAQNVQSAAEYSHAATFYNASEPDATGVSFNIA